MAPVAYKVAGNGIACDTGRYRKRGTLVLEDSTGLHKAVRVGKGPHFLSSNAFCAREMIAGVAVNGAAAVAAPIMATNVSCSGMVPRVVASSSFLTRSNIVYAS